VAATEIDAEIIRIERELARTRESLASTLDDLRSRITNIGVPGLQVLPRELSISTRPALATGIAAGIGFALGSGSRAKMIGAFALGGILGFWLRSALRPAALECADYELETGNCTSAIDAEPRNEQGFEEDEEFQGSTVIPSTDATASGDSRNEAPRGARAAVIAAVAAALAVSAGIASG